MKIDNSINLNSLNISIDSEFIKEGTLIKGEILDIVGDLVIIDVEGLGIVKAYTQKDLNEQRGKVLNFIVKTSLPNKIELKPISINPERKETVDITSKTETYLINILKKFHIDDNPISTEFLDNLVKYNVQINKANLIDGIKIFEKLEQILNLSEDEVITLANPNEENFNIGKVDIRNFIIKNKDEINSKHDLAPKITEYLSELPDNKIDTEIIKTISFFIKYDIKPTISNLKYFKILKEKPELFSEDFKILEEIVDKKFTNFYKRIIIDNGSPKNLVEEKIIEYKKTLDRINNYIKENSPIVDKNLKKSIKELRSKVEFLEEMNKELTFVYLPLNLNYDKYNSVVTLLKKKKKENESNNKINIFINLSTKRLGDIKIYCKVCNRFINVKFSKLDKEDLKIFKSNEDRLKALVKPTGYEINSIEYSFDENDNILDSLIVNTKPIYYLDVQV